MKLRKSRELMFEISEINKDTNVFPIAYKLMNALIQNEITSHQFELLCGELEFECWKHGSETKNQFCSLYFAKK